MSRAADLPAPAAEPDRRRELSCHLTRQQRRRMVLSRACPFRRRRRARRAGRAGLGVDRHGPEGRSRVSAPRVLAGGEERRTHLLDRLAEARSPVSGAELAGWLGVSRQVVVQDVAILRAGGAPILATARGYLLPGPDPR